MSLCRLMVYDFMYGQKTFDYGMHRNARPYDRHDLQMGLAYAEGYMTDGLTTEPFYGFPFEKFAKWCTNKLIEEASTKKQEREKTTMTKEKKAYQWDYDGQFKPGAAPYQQQQSFSVGIFQWVPKANGKGLKRSAVRYRIRGSYHNPQAVYYKAQAKCDALNQQQERDEGTKPNTQ